jgi:hypothetical protein
MKDMRERKLAEAKKLRGEAVAAKAVSASVCNLAPVVGQELEALVQLKVQSGALAGVWAKARKAAAGNEELNDDGQAIAAMAAMLTAHSRTAAQCIKEHGEQLRDKSAAMIGKADAIEELVAEVMAAQPEDTETETPPDSGNGVPEGATEPEP